jgi:hypothetical protein
MRAQKLHHSKVPVFDGSVIEIAIWQLPEVTKERPHGLKYRCNYSLPDGASLVRYDNESGKGDHKHIGNVEEPYVFSTIEQLFTDFFNDITANGGLLQ